MKVLVVRHAVAEDREEFTKSGETDDLRPITKEGEKKMKKIVKWLRDHQSNIDVIWTSPFIRAKQTSEILKSEFKKTPIKIKKQLEPEISPDGLFRELIDYQLKDETDDKVVAVVGHEPHLSRFLAWSITGQPGQILQLKKGGMALIDLSKNSKPGDALLRWLVSPKQVLKA